MTNVKVISLSDTERIVVDCDDNAENPLYDWEFEAGMFTVECARGCRLMNADWRGINEQLRHIADRRDRSGLDYPSKDALFDAMRKHLTRQGMTVKTLTLRGVTQSDWWDVIAYGDDADYVSAMVDAVQRYLSNEVYTIRRETLVTYADVTDSTRTLTQWEPDEDSQEFGVYLDSLSDAEILSYVAVVR